MSPVLADSAVNSGMELTLVLESYILNKLAASWNLDLQFAFKNVAGTWNESEKNPASHSLCKRLPMDWLSSQFERLAFLRGLSRRAGNAGACAASAGVIMRDWVWDALLILPLAATSLWLLASGRDFNVFWGDDERNYHFPLMLEFARQWPHFNLRYDSSATTPLLHMIGATLIKLFGVRMMALRLLNTLASAIGILWLRRFLLRERGFSAASSTLGAAVLMFSFYFFGFSFRVLTDNLSLIFCLLALGGLYRFLADSDNRIGAYVGGCIWMALALFTRQSCVFLCLPFAAALFLRRDLGWKTFACGLAAFCFALLPLIALLMVWKGFVPPAVQQRHTPGSFPFYLQSVVMPLSILGFYTVFFRAQEIHAWILGNFRNRSHPQTWKAIGVLAICLSCSIFLAGGTSDDYTGIIHTAAAQLPRIFGLGALIWLVLPVGLAAAFYSLIGGALWNAVDSGKIIGSLTFIGLCLVSMTNHVATQKYWDATVLVCVLLSLPSGQAETRPWRFSMWLLIGICCVYQIVRQASVWYARD